MKYLLSFFIILHSYAVLGDSWIQRADFPAERSRALGFTIGSKGYVGLGYRLSAHVFKDWWSFDPSSNTWTQQADFPGFERSDAFGFVIGNKGYVGCGYPFSDFYEYDPSNNTWNQKSNFPTARTDASAFSIGGKGYVGCGFIGQNRTNDFWEYDPASDTWLAKADVPGSPRSDAIGFSINGKGYIGFGNDTTGIFTNDFYEFDAGLNTWTNKPDFPGTPFYIGSSFVIGDCGYVTEANGNTFWQFNTVANSWIQKTDFAGSLRYNASSFEINGKGYVCIGDTGVVVNGEVQTSTVWEYTPDSLDGINELFFLQTGIQIYPNPARDFIVVRTSHPVELSAFTEEGKLLFKQRKCIDGDRINVGSWAAGIYFLRVETDLKNAVYKLVKE